MPKGPRTPDVARRLVDAYVTSLRQHLPTYCIRQLDKLPGAQEHQLTRLRQSYPGAPLELLYLLRRVNGTCWESLLTASGAVPPAAPQPQAAASESMGAAAASSPGASPAAAAAAAAAKSSPTAAATPKSSATKPASIASEAAAFIKSHIAKQVKGAQRPRRVPQYVALPILGSSYTACPYYLKSVDQMLLAEQQFPPASANLPDEGDSWTPPPPPSSSSPSSPASTTQTSAPTNTAAAAGTATSAEGGVEGGRESMMSDATASGVPLNKNTIASVFAKCKIVYGAPPSEEGKAAAAAKGLPVTPVVELSSWASSGAVGQGEASPVGIECDGKVVFVDPRIDVNANFYQWLAFADSVQPHVRERVPTIPDADPAKVAAAAAATNGGATPLATLTPIAASTQVPPTAAATTTEPVTVFAASRLYLDFQPVELHGGVYGQVIQFVHGEPSSFTVVASDFGSYLKYIMAEEYGFTEELEDDEDDDEDDGEEDLITARPPSGGSNSSSGSSTAGASSSSSASSAASASGSASSTAAKK